MFGRRSLVWRYCALGSFFVYVVSFTAFLAFIKSSAMLEKDSNVVMSDFLYSSNSSVVMSTRSLAARLDGKPSGRSKTGHLNSSDSKHIIGDFHKNMTLLKVNMSGIQDILKHVNRNETASELEKPVNPHPFRYLINCPHVCRSLDVYILAYVHTAPEHIKRRMVIRQTWGDARNYDVTMRVIFVMGKMEREDVHRAVMFEAEQYSDIVQEDFLDTYRNLTYKGIAALKWISNHCPHARFVLKTDDDIFVNTFVLIKHLKRREKMGKEENTHMLMCLVWYNMIVMRDGKWKVDESEWKEATYPTYCSGSAYLMSTDLAVDLHRISYRVPFFWVDDFYITGLLPVKLGNVKHVQFMSSYVLNGLQLAEKFTGPQWYKYVFSHVHNLNAIQGVWKTVVRIARGEIAPTIPMELPGHLPKVELVQESAPKAVVKR